MIALPWLMLDITGSKSLTSIVAMSAYLPVAIFGLIAGTVVDTKGFRFAQLKSFRNPDFLPGAVKYGDLPALLALAAPHPLYLVGENGKVPQLVSATYGAIGKTEQVHSKAGDAGLQAGLQWIIAGGQ